MTQSISSPILNLMATIVQNESMRRRFIQNEEAFFDLYGLSNEDRDLIRNSSSLDEISKKLAAELSQFSQPGKVAIRVEGDQASSLVLLYNLVENIDLRNKFIINEKMEGVELDYRQLAFTTFGVNTSIQSQFISLVDDDALMEDAVSKICNEIRSEVIKIRKQNV